MLWAAFAMGQLVSKMWERFTLKKMRGPDQFWQIRKRKGKTELTADGNRRRRMKKNLNSSDLRCEGTLIPSILRGEVRRWVNYLASGKVRERYSEVELEDEGRESIAQDIVRTRRIIAPSDGVR